MSNMRVLISCDIEGTAGIVDWAEAEAGKDSRWYEYFCRQMTREAAAACEPLTSRPAKWCGEARL